MDPQELDALFEAHPTALAPALLGCSLSVSTPQGQVIARITEVEAYGDEGEDPGAHSFRGKTPRNASLFGPARHLYIYLSYGIHHCANLVGNGHRAGGVLLRAGEVTGGRELAVTRRGGRDTGHQLLSGPGRFAQGMGLTLPMDGDPLSITAEELADRDLPSAVQLRPPVPPPDVARCDPESIRSGPRVGVSGDGGSGRFPWRYWLDGEPSVSRFRPGRNTGIL